MKSFVTTVVFMATKSYNQLKLMNLVTMATIKFVERSFLKPIREVVTEILVFGKLYRTIWVSMAIKSYNQLKFLNLVTNKQNCIKGVFDTYKEGGNRNISF